MLIIMLMLILKLKLMTVLMLMLILKLMFMLMLMLMIILKLMLRLMLMLKPIRSLGTCSNRSNATAGAFYKQQITKSWLSNDHRFSDNFFHR